MTQNVYSFINGFFDFEYEDQPDNIEDYTSMIDFMWQTAERHGITSKLKTALINILKSEDDPTIALNSYFLPGKHDLKEVLQMALDREMILHSQSFGQNENPLEYIRRFFDFNYEDQPDSLEDYAGMIDCMWSKAKFDNREEEIAESIKSLLASQEDASEKMGFVFLPGKHEVEDILKVTLERMPASSP